MLALAQTELFDFDAVLDLRAALRAPIGPMRRALELATEMTLELAVVREPRRKLQAIELYGRASDLARCDAPGDWRRSVGLRVVRLGRDAK